MKYDASTELGLEWAGHVELRDAYDWEPATLIEGLPPEAVIGVEAAVWTETLRDLRRPDDDAAAAARRRRRGRVDARPSGATGTTSAPGSRGTAPFWDRLGLALVREPAGRLGRADGRLDPGRQPHVRSATSRTG